MNIETFTAARSRATAELGIPTEAWGAEDDQAYRVYESAGEPKTLAGIEIPAAAPWEYADAPVILVDKETGEVTEVAFLDDMDRFATMSPVGEGYPPDLFD